MPDLRGMTGADALFILENNNIRVRLRGAGSVIKQSILPGTKIPATREVILDLTV
jgi:cell division protein FtsI (penicillin-binding protein 3)